MDFLFEMAFVTKLVLTATIVVIASMVTERVGPLIGALVVTLPVTVWPAFVFLALDHDAAFLAASAVAGLAINAITAIFMLLYVLLAHKLGLVVSLTVALTTWIVLALVARSIVLTFVTAGLLNIVLYPCCLWLSNRFRAAAMPAVTTKWYDVPVRTLFVCSLMAAVLVIGNWAGPATTGMIAVFPISTTCTMLILQPRIGGRATAAVIANGIWGMVGISGGLTALYLAVERFGIVPALALALAVPVTWNFTVWISGHRRSRPVEI
jgi:hypothetical protein